MCGGRRGLQYKAPDFSLIAPDGFLAIMPSLPNRKCLYHSPFCFLFFLFFFFLKPGFEQRVWKKNPPVCQRVAGTLCIKISVQVERHKIRSVSLRCIINTPLFISLPIESVHNKMLPRMKYLCNFLALHVVKKKNGKKGNRTKVGVTHSQLAAAW